MKNAAKMSVYFAKIFSLIVFGIVRNCYSVEGELTQYKYLASNLSRYNKSIDMKQSSPERKFVTPIKNSSQNRIDRLFQKFESFKSRVTNSSRRKQSQIAEKVLLFHHSCIPKDISILLSQNPPSRSQPQPQFPARLQSQLHLADSNDPDQGLNPNSKQHQQSYQAIFQAAAIFFADRIRNAQDHIQRKIAALDNKLNIYEAIIRGIKAVRSVKQIFKQNEFNQENLKMQYHQSNSFTQLVDSYEAKIRALVQVYEEQLRQLESNSSKGRETLSTKKGSLRSELNQFESLLLSKDSEIGALRLQNCRLRKANDRLMNDANSTAKLVSELEDSFRYQKQQKDVVSKQVEIQVNLLNLEGQICCKEMKMKKRLSIQGINSFSDRRLLFKKLTLNSHRKQRMRQCSLEKIKPDASEPGIAQEDICHFKSQVIQPKPKRVKEEAYKKMIAELDLICQQNQRLISQNNQFSRQINSNEADEERFQQQSTIYKEQIKQLNSNVSSLEKLLANVMGEKKLNWGSVEQLRQGMRGKTILMGKYRQ